jgi:hypothetical protein
MFHRTIIELNVFPIVVVHSTIAKFKIRVCLLLVVVVVVIVFEPILL